MPRGDRSGPRDAGPMTGRARGVCAGFDAPGFMWPGAGMGFGRGLGRGHGGGRAPGWGRGYGAAWGRGAGAEAWGLPAPPWRREAELETLKRESEQLRDNQKMITKRIEELEKYKRD